jgi:hypothetical protein
MKLKIWILVALTIVGVACGSEANNENSNAAITVEELAKAKSNFAETIASLGDSVLSGGVGVSGGAVFGISASSEKGIISVWDWDGSKFGYGTELTLLEDWCGSECTWGIDNLQVADLTGEGNDDIFVDYHLNDPESQVFSQVSGSWSSLKFDLGTFGAKIVGAKVVAYHEPCLPSCAEGRAIEISYSWNGMLFESYSVDDFGNKFSLVIGQSCSVFTPNDYEPYKLCDKGNGIGYLQQVLFESGLLYTTSSNPIDGYFGPETEYSVKVFQYTNQLKVDGLVEGQWYRDLIENYNIVNGIVG